MKIEVHGLILVGLIHGEIIEKNAPFIKRAKLYRTFADICPVLELTVWKIWSFGYADTKH